MKKLIIVVSLFLISISISGCKDRNEASIYNDDSTGDDQQEIVENKENNSEEIVNHFEDLEQEIDDALNESDSDKLKEKAKNIVVNGIDFIFYGKQINGVTFEQLTDEAKEKIIYIVASIDSKIENKIPGYKESIKDKAGQGYEYASEKFKQGLDYIDSKLNEKYGQSYEDAKDKVNEVTDDIKDTASDIYDKTTEKFEYGWGKIKEWYEEKTNKE